MAYIAQRCAHTATHTHTDGVLVTSTQPSLPVLCVVCQESLKSKWAELVGDIGAPINWKLRITGTSATDDYDIWRTSAADALLQVLLR